MIQTLTPAAALKAATAIEPDRTPTETSDSISAAVFAAAVNSAHLDQTIVRTFRSTLASRFGSAFADAVEVSTTHTRHMRVQTGSGVVFASVIPDMHGGVLVWERELPVGEGVSSPGAATTNPLPMRDVVAELGLEHLI